MLGDGDELGTGEAGGNVGLAGGGLAGDGDLAGLGLAPARTETGVRKVASDSKAWEASHPSKYTQGALIGRSEVTLLPSVHQPLWCRGSCTIGRRGHSCSVN